MYCYLKEAVSQWFWSWLAGKRNFVIDSKTTHFFTNQNEKITWILSRKPIQIELFGIWHRWPRFSSFHPFSSLRFWAMNDKNYLQSTHKKNFRISFYWFLFYWFYKSIFKPQLNKGPCFVPDQWQLLHYLSHLQSQLQLLGLHCLHLQRSKNKRTSSLHQHRHFVLAKCFKSRHRTLWFVCTCVCSAVQIKLSRYSSIKLSCTTEQDCPVQ